MGRHVASPTAGLRGEGRALRELRGEAPGAFRRRLSLERAAWRLARGASVTEAGIEAGYEAVEAFSRAFTRAHGGNWLLSAVQQTQ